MKSYAVTLTYGGDDRVTGAIPLKARLLDFRDMTLYLKRLRNFVKVRYLACGEYGTLKGRGHWHVIIFTNGLIPNLQLNRNFIHEGPTISQGDSPSGSVIWNEGFSYWQEATYQHMRYACAYVLKQLDGKPAERRFGASRHPPLGRQWFRLKAEQHVRQGLSPQDCFYSFPEVRKKDGTPRRFLLSRRSADYYKQDFIDAWVAARDDDWPQSDMIDEYLDKAAAQLSLRPGDWLEQRRFLMKKAGKKWDGLEGSSVSVGMIATRETNAMHPSKLDDKLRVMGNRKGQGYTPSSELLQANLSRALVKSTIPSDG